MKDIAHAKLGYEIADLGECCNAFGEWWHVLSFNFALVAIASDSYERGHERGYEDGLLEGPPMHRFVPSGWVPGCGQEAP